MPTDDLPAARRRRIDESHRCEPGHCALLVIDMQHGFLDKGASLEVPKGRELIPNIARLINRCREEAIPVIFTEFVYADNVPCLRGNPFGPEHLHAEEGQPTGYGFPSSNCRIGPDAGTGPESARTIHALKPLSSELVVRAHNYDKFYGTPLDLALRSQNITHLMTTGVTTDICVNSTIVSSSTRNYRVTAITDAVATIHDHIQTACFQIWENKFARLKTTAEIISELG
jgi:nicotinamidase-related amidase